MSGPTRRPRSRAPRAAGCALAALALLSACGKKGPPLPPLSRLPVAPTEVAARRAGDEVRIRFVVPAANVSGVRPADIERVDVYAWTGPVLPDQQLFKLAKVVASVPVRRPPPPQEPDEDGRPAPPPPAPTGPGVDQGAWVELSETLQADAYEPIALKDPLPAASMREVKLAPPEVGPPLQPPPVRRYVVLGVNRGGRRGARAAPVAVPLWPAPPPPTGLTAEVRQDAIRLAWRAPQGLRRPVQIGSPPPPAKGEAPAPPPAGGRVPVPDAAEGVEDVDGLEAFGDERISDDVLPGQDEAVRPVEPAPRQVTPPPRQETPAPAEDLPSAASGSVLRARVLFPWPAGSSGFHVYEVTPPSAGSATSPETAPPPPSLLTPKPVSGATFADPRVEYGTRRCFAVRTVETLGAMTVESVLSDPVCVEPVDVFPPPAPKSLAAVASAGAISLIWEASAGDDLAGYIVLRGLVPGGALQPLTPQPIRDTTYRDTAVTPGTRYVYAVVAVDSAKPPNRSEPSDRAEETAR